MPKLSWGVFPLVMGCAGAPPPPSQPSPLLSRMMPGFEGDTLSRNHFYSAQATGYPMIVTFFSSKCAGCRESLAVVQRVYGGNSELVVVGISEDETEAKARHFVDDVGAHFPVIHDADGKLSKEYLAERMPRTFVITPNGSVTWVGGAEQTEDGVRAAVRAARK